MPHNRPLRLKVAGRKEILLPALLVSFLILIAAVLSPQPIAMIPVVTVLLGAGWVLFNFRISRTPAHLISVIYPDGSVKIEFAGNVEVAGVLSGQQWCNSQFAVLSFETDGKRHNLVLLSAQQEADEYRRLLVWLRHGLLIQVKEVLKQDLQQ